MSGPSRRAFFLGLGAAALSAPAVIRIPGLLMPVKALEVVPWRVIDVSHERFLRAYASPAYLDALMAELMITGKVVRRFVPQAYNMGGVLVDG